MLHLRILGGAAVLASDGALTGAAGRRRALALLALVASARDEGLARDRALAMLWPELDSDRARNNLKQLVFSLRRALTPDVFAATGPVLRLDPNVITVDVWAYEKAIADGTLENAVARYGGPFLDAFGVPGLVEFERWVETERARLARVHAETLETLAERARRAGQLEIAAAWRRHLAALDPLSARHAVSFVRALADAGDIPGALRHAHLFERLVRNELDADVGPEMRLLVAQLRMRSDPSGDRVIRSDEVVILTEETRAAKAAAVLEPSLGAPPVPPVRWYARLTRPVTTWFRGGGRRRLAIAGLAVANVIVLSVASRNEIFAPTAALGEIAPDLPATVAVFSFHGRAGALTGELGRAAAELLSTSLDGGTGFTAFAAPVEMQAITRAVSGDSTAVDKAAAARAAERVGARLFVLGNIVEVGGRLRLTATLHDRVRPETTITKAVADGSGSEMFEIVDRLAAQLLAGRFPGARGALARVAASTTKSLPATKAYLAAEQHLGSGRFSTAVDALRDAVRMDSGFAIAYYRLSQAAELLGREAEARDAAESALRVAERTDDHYRRVFAAAVARLHGDVESAEAKYTRLVYDYQDDPDAWLGLGETLFHLNPIRGQPATAARDAFIKVLELDPRHVRALAHLARIDALRGDSAAANEWVRKARELSTDEIVGGLALHVRALGGAPAVGSVDRQRLQRASTLHRGPGPRELLVGRGPEPIDRFAVQFLSADVQSDLAAYGHRLAAYTSAARGQYKGALRHLDQAQESDVDSDIEVRSFIALVGADALDSATLAQTRLAVERWQPSYLNNPEPTLDAIARARAHALLRQHRLALIAIRAGDVASAARIAARLETEPDPDNGPTARILAQSIRARLAAVGGDSTGALRILANTRWTQARRAAAAEPLDRLMHADLLLAAGRPVDAARWYATLGDGAPDELPLLGFAELGLGRAHDLLNDPSTALRHYRHAVELWKDADPGISSLRDAASKRITALEAESR